MPLCQLTREQIQDKVTIETRRIMRGADKVDGYSLICPPKVGVSKTRGQRFKVTGEGFNDPKSNNIKVCIKYTLLI